MRVVAVAAVLSVLALLAATLVAADFNLTNAVRGVYYSKVAYCSKDGIKAWSCGACPKFPSMTNVSVFIDEGQDAQAFVGYNADLHEIVLAFRGTVNLPGWIVDLDFFATNYTPNGADCAGCLVHQGLYWGYQRVAEPLWPHLQALAAAYPTADIFVAGHSMGAGMAGFAYPDVVRTVKSQGTKRLYNFGSPRIGNPAFVKWLETIVEPHKEHYRSTNFGDPVVHMPPIIFDEFGLGNWLHIPREVFFTNPFVPPQTDFRVCNGSFTREDPTCADSTPIWDMLSFVNHTTYLNIGLGCFLA